MLLSDLSSIFTWWIVLLLIGGAFLPLTTLLFSQFLDRGYVFSKILGMLLLSYTLFLFGSLKFLPFTQTAIIVVLGGFIGLNVWILRKNKLKLRDIFRSSWKIFALEELLFLGTLTFWSYIRAHEPSIHGLEKYMDQGFVNSILRSDYFPPKDMWYTSLPINYYYFGHLVTAVLTKLSGITPFITYNLMMATLFALLFTGAFSIGINLISMVKRGVAGEGAPHRVPAGRKSTEDIGWGWSPT